MKPSPTRGTSRPAAVALHPAMALRTAVERLRRAERDLEALARQLRKAQPQQAGPGGSAEDVSQWTLAGERLQAVECVLADHLIPAQKALLRVLETPQAVLRGEFDEARQEFSRIGRQP